MKRVIANMLMLCAAVAAFTIAVAMMFGTAMGVLVGVLTIFAGTALLVTDYLENRDTTSGQPKVMKKAKVVLQGPHYADPSKLVDPRGDGSLEVGDPLWDAILQASDENAEGVLGIWDDEAEDWHLMVVPKLPDEPKHAAPTPEELDELLEKWE